MAEEALVKVVSRQNYPQDSWWKIRLALVSSLVLNVVLSLYLGYIFLTPPPPVYFPTSQSGRLTPLYPLNAPNQADASVLQWSSQAAIDVFTYNYVNWRTELEADSGYFTANGWETFVNFLKQTNIIGKVVTGKLVVTAQPTLAPYFSRRGILNGVYAWRVQMPIVATYQGLTMPTQENYMISMLIIRVPASISPNGIAIDQFIVDPASAGLQQVQ